MLTDVAIKALKSKEKLYKAVDFHPELTRVGA